MPKKTHVEIKAVWPFKGQVQSPGYSQQPPDTAVVCQNVMPFDPGAGRQRGGQRGGTTAIGSVLNGATARVSRLHQVQKADGSGTKCCALSNGSLYAGADFTSLALVTAGLVTNLANNTAPHSCDIFGKVYFVDGVIAAPKTYDPVAGTTGTLAATAGVLPGVATLCCNFRGRLVLVVGQNLYFSRAGTPTDFDYSQRDVLAAVATGATSTFGRISQPIYAIVPFSNDTMIVGCDHSMLLVKGDPAGGGVMLTISDSIGMLYKDGWCIDPAGNFYFLGTGGFFRIAAGTQTIENLSVGKMDAYYAQIPKSHNVQLAWDRDNKGCWIFATPYSLPRHHDHQRHQLLRRADGELLADGLPVQPRAGKRVRVRRRHDDGPLPRPGRARRAVPQVRHVRPHRRRDHDQLVHHVRAVPPRRQRAGDAHRA
jgi:hypothetical protein